MRLGLRAVLAFGIAAATTACAAVLGIEDGVPRTDGAPDTSPPDAKTSDSSMGDSAPRTTCDPFAPFGKPIAQVTLNTPSAQDLHARLTPDELTIVFASDRLGTAGSLDLYTSTRGSIQVPFNGPSSLGPSVNTKFDDSDPALSADGKTLYFASTRGIIPQWDLWTSVRTTPQTAFGLPTNVMALNSPNTEWSPFVTSTGDSLLFASNRNGGMLIYSSDLKNGFGAPVPLAGMTDAGPGHDDRSGALSQDGLVLYFSSNRPGSANFDIWVTTRAAIVNPFGAPKLVTELSTPGEDYVSWISNDLCRVYFSTNKNNSSTDFDLFYAERPL